VKDVGLNGSVCIDFKAGLCSAYIAIFFQAAILASKDGIAQMTGDQEAFGGNLSDEQKQLFSQILLCRTRSDCENIKDSVMEIINLVHSKERLNEVFGIVNKLFINRFVGFHLGEVHVTATKYARTFNRDEALGNLVMSDMQKPFEQQDPGLLKQIIHFIQYTVNCDVVLYDMTGGKILLERVHDDALHHNYVTVHLLRTEAG
jgi:hypothetical protein